MSCNCRAPGRTATSSGCTRTRCRRSRLADRLGYDHAWVVEHHFLEEYSHSPSPESFLAAASQRTKNIRLGHGILQLTTNHPARVAERVAVLDLLSNGRCEFGMGESASITELTPFGRDMETKNEVFEEAVAGDLPDVHRCGTRASRQVFRHPLAQRRAEAGAEAASAVVDGLLATADHRARRPSTALARSASSSSAPTPRMPGCTPITTPSPSG